MNIKVADFRQVAEDGGYAQQSLIGKSIVTAGAGTGLLGVLRGAITWIRSILDGKSVRNENRKVMQSFVETIRGEYGDRFGDIAQNDLNSAISDGKYLDARMIRVELERMDKLEEKRQVIRNMASEYSSTIETESGECFGSIYERLSKEKNFDKYLGRPLGEDSLELRDRIYKEIMDKGMEKGEISHDEARAIAEKEIGSFIDAKKKIMDDKVMVEVLKSFDDRIEHLSKTLSQKPENVEIKGELKEVKKQKEIVENFVLQTPGIPDAKYVKAILDRREDVCSFITTLGNNNLSPRDHQKACGELCDGLAKSAMECMQKSGYRKNFQMFCNHAIQLSTRLAGKDYKAHHSEAALLNCLSAWQPVAWYVANSDVLQGGTPYNKANDMKLFLGSLSRVMGESRDLEEEPSDVMLKELGKRGMLGPTLEKKVSEKDRIDDLNQKKKEEPHPKLRFIEVARKMPDWREGWMEEQLKSMTNQKIKDEWSDALKQAQINVTYIEK